MFRSSNVDNLMKAASVQCMMIPFQGNLLTDLHLVKLTCSLTSVVKPTEDHCDKFLGECCVVIMPTVLHCMRMSTPVHYVVRDICIHSVV